MEADRSIDRCPLLLIFQFNVDVVGGSLAVGLYGDQDFRLDLFADQVPVYRVGAEPADFLGLLDNRGIESSFAHGFAGEGLGIEST